MKKLTEKEILSIVNDVNEDMAERHSAAKLRETIKYLSVENNKLYNRLSSIKTAIKTAIWDDEIDNGTSE